MKINQLLGLGLLQRGRNKMKQTLKKALIGMALAGVFSSCGTEEKYIRRIELIDGYRVDVARTSEYLGYIGSSNNPIITDTFEHNSVKNFDRLDIYNFEKHDKLIYSSTFIDLKSDGFVDQISDSRGGSYKRQDSDTKFIFAEADKKLLEKKKEFGVLAEADEMILK